MPTQVLVLVLDANHPAADQTVVVDGPVQCSLADRRWCVDAVDLCVDGMFFAQRSQPDTWFVLAARQPSL